MQYAKTRELSRRRATGHLATRKGGVCHACAATGRVRRRGRPRGALMAPCPIAAIPVAILWGRGSMAEAPWPTTGGSNVRYSRSPPRRRLRRRLLRCLQLVPNIVSRSSIQSTAEALLTRCSLPRVAVPRRPCRVGRAASCHVGRAASVVPRLAASCHVGRGASCLVSRAAPGSRS